MRAFLLLLSCVGIFGAETNGPLFSTNGIPRLPKTRLATNSPAASLNAYQTYYTNWANAYLDAKAQLRKEIGQYQAKSELASRKKLGRVPVDKNIEVLGQRIKAMQTGRMTYELKNPDAREFAPNIPGWKSDPISISEVYMKKVNN